MTRLFDHRGQAVVLGKEIGKGGEGAVFEIQGSTNVAKVYKKSPDKAKQTKLQAMVGMAKDDLTKVAAWPIATLHSSPGGSMTGLVMPRIVGFKEIHTLYSPAQRKLQYPQADWSFLAHTAANCAIVFEAMHRYGVVIGDVNQSNAMVSEKSLVRWIDCDSVQMDTYAGRCFCDVGVPLFTPPELQGRAYKGLSRTTNHDNFGLAVLIFHLMFMGRHPYVGRFQGRGEMPVERAITEHRFAYSVKQGQQTEMLPPPQSLALTNVSPDLGNLFEKAFARESAVSGRPTPQQWVAALQAFSKSLKPCKKVLGHLVPQHLQGCPWCALMDHGSPNFFISVYVYRSTGQTVQSTFVLAVIWQQISSVGPPPTAYQRPATRTCAPTALPPGVPAEIPPRYVEPTTPEQRGMWWGAIGAGTLSVIFLVALSYWVALVPFLGFVGLGCVWFYFEIQRRGCETEPNRRRNDAIRRLRAEADRRQTVHDDAARRLETLESKWMQVSQLRAREFSAKYQALLKAKQDYEAIPGQIATDRQQLLRQAEQMQRTAFLQATFIEDATIVDIGPVRKATLASNGIETAFDVDHRIAGLSGFGPKLTKRMLEWRSSIERSFRFDPAKGIPDQEQRVLDMKYLQIKQGLEARLTAGVAELKVLRATADQEIGKVYAKIVPAIQAAYKASADLSAIPSRRLR